MNASLHTSPANTTSSRNVGSSYFVLRNVCAAPAVSSCFLALFGLFILSAGKQASKPDSDNKADNEKSSLLRCAMVRTFVSYIVNRECAYLIQV